METTKTLNLDAVILVQKRNLERKLAERKAKEIAERNENAKSYSAQTKCKREKFSKVRCAIICAIFFIAGAIPLTMGIHNAFADEIATESETPVYVICDVTNAYCDEEGTYLVCKMPNGELHEYAVTDAPVPASEIKVVTLKTYNQDNFEAYEVVAIR